MGSKMCVFMFLVEEVLCIDLGFGGKPRGKGLYQGRGDICLHTHYKNLCYTLSITRGDFNWLSVLFLPGTVHQLPPFTNSLVLIAMPGVDFLTVVYDEFSL